MLTSSHLVVTGLPPLQPAAALNTASTPLRCHHRGQELLCPQVLCRTGRWTGQLPRLPQRIQQRYTRRRSPHCRQTRRQGQWYERGSSLHQCRGHLKQNGRQHRMTYLQMLPLFHLAVFCDRAYCTICHGHIMKCKKVPSNAIAECRSNMPKQNGCMQTPSPQTINCSVVHI